MNLPIISSFPERKFPFPEFNSHRLSALLGTILVLFSLGCRSHSGLPFTGSWFHSPEDEDGVQGEWQWYRPMGYPFPAARVRSGFMLEKQGRFALIKPSVLDGRDTVWGSWQRQAQNQIRIQIPGSPQRFLTWRTPAKERLSLRFSDSP